MGCPHKRDKRGERGGVKQVVTPPVADECAMVVLLHPWQALRTQSVMETGTIGSQSSPALSSRRIHT